MKETILIAGVSPGIGKAAAKLLASNGWIWSALRLFILTAFWFSSPPTKCADITSNSVPVEPFDYAQPKLLTGTIYETGSEQQTILFKFQRSAERSGTTVRVERLFSLPDGSTGAVEHIVYESGRLVSCEIRDLQAGLWGTIQVGPDPKNPARQAMVISHGKGTEAKAKNKATEMPKDTLIGDMVYPFTLSRWNELMGGATVKFRLASLERETTYGFKLSKAAEMVVNGKLAVVIRMEPTSLFVARFMNAIYLSIEKDGAHRILEYVGRTTPRIKKGSSWKYLEADTVFDWPQGQSFSK